MPATLPVHSERRVRLESPARNVVARASDVVRTKSGGQCGWRCRHAPARFGPPPEKESRHPTRLSCSALRSAHGAGRRRRPADRPAPRVVPRLLMAGGCGGAVADACQARVGASTRKLVPRPEFVSPQLRATAESRSASVRPWSAMAWSSRMYSPHRAAGASVARQPTSTKHVATRAIETPRDLRRRGEYEATVAR